jgi:predicted amino acid dehydrogenase
MAVADDILSAIRESNTDLTNILGELTQGFLSVVDAIKDLGSLTQSVNQQAQTVAGATQPQLAAQGKQGAPILESLTTEFGTLATNIAGAIGGVVGGIGGAVAETMGTVADKIIHARSESERANAENREFSRFSGLMANAYAQQDIAKVYRDIDFAHATEATATELAESVTRMRESFLGFDVVAANTSNTLNRTLADFGTIGGTIATDLGQWLQSFMPVMAEAMGMRPGQTIMDRLLQQMADPNNLFHGLLGMFAGNGAVGGFDAWIARMRALLQRQPGGNIDLGAATLFNMGFPWWRVEMGPANHPVRRRRGQ